MAGVLTTLQKLKLVLTPKIKKWNSELISAEAKWQMTIRKETNFLEFPDENLGRVTIILEIEEK